jgi:3-deoxy-manno-octulosonate cytidylyltransferase (CMP-KDO synthetase)
LSKGKCLKHIGLYAFRKGALKEFCDTPPVDIEKCEGLEQLRALWLGLKIKVILTDFESWGVDTPEDVLRVEKILKRRNHGRSGN